MLPIDYDEDDYLRAGQLYATGIQEGDLGVFLRDNYRTEHPPLSKIITGLALAPLDPVPEIPDRPTTAEPATDLPQPHLDVARSVNAAFGVATAVLLAIVSPVGGLFLAVHTWTVKYSSQVMLEAVPAFFALLAVVLASRAWRTELPGRRSRVARGGRHRVRARVRREVSLWRRGPRDRGRLAMADQRGHRADDGRRTAGRVARWVLPVAGWFVLGFAVFMIASPYLWPDPVGRLVSSITYHGGYATSERCRTPAGRCGSRSCGSWAPSRSTTVARSS